MNVDDDTRPDDTPQLTPDQTPAEAPQTPEPPVDEEDVDALELRAAMEAAQAEKAASTGEPGEDQGANSDPSTPNADEGKQDPKAAVPMIPKPRFDEVNRQAQEAERRAAYWQGIAEASRQAPAGQQQPPAQAPQPTPDPLETNRNQILDLAKKFDEGELSMAEYKQKELELYQQRDEILLQRARPQQPQISLADQHFINSQTEAMAKAHPYVDLVSDQQFQQLVNLAKIELQGTQWAQMQAGPAKDMMLKEKVAVLSDQFGPVWVGPLQQQPATNGQQPLSPQAKARQAKLDLAAQMPPDLSAMGGGAVAQAPSPQAIENMDEEAILALPASVRQAVFERRA